jgi:predicted MPP superfamily phosphohydrolase
MPKSTRSTRRYFLKTAGVGLFAGIATYLYTWRIEPHWVDVVRRDLPIARLPSDLVGRTIVQLSDLHAGDEVDDDYLIGALRSVADFQPDIIAVTGDFMTTVDTREVDHAVSVLSHLPPARLATVAVPGNHDYGIDYDCVEAADELTAGLTRLGMVILRNARHEVAGLTITGLDDYWAPNFCPKKILPQIDSKEANLVLCHNPDVADLDVWAGYKGWILSGHTHGGQCKPPGLRPPFLPVKNKRYVAGEYDLFDGRRMYINRGLGYLHHRARFNVRPEITLFTLRQADSFG